MKHKCLIRTPAGFRQLVLKWTEELLRPTEFGFEEHELGFTTDLNVEEIKRLLKFGPWYEDVMIALCYQTPVPHREYVPKHLKKLRSFFLESNVHSIGLAVRIRHDSIHTVRRVREAFALVLKSSVTKNQTPATPSHRDSVASSSMAKTSKREITVHGQDIPSQLEVLISIEKRKMDVWASLSGSGLYKRGNREVGGFLAPMREDLAACLLTMTMPKHEFYLWLPFAGSGTYYFETCQLARGYEHPSFKKLFAIENKVLDKLSQSSLFQNNPVAEESSQPNLSATNPHTSEDPVVTKTVKTLMTGALLEDIHKETLEKLSNTLASFSEKLKNLDLVDQDFFKSSDDRFSDKDIFLPVNPPWGVRLGKSVDEKFFYHLGKKLKTIKTKSLGGFVLCPSEGSCKAFLSGYKESADIFHFTQGGKHIRAVILARN